MKENSTLRYEIGITGRAAVAWRGRWKLAFYLVEFYEYNRTHHEGASYMFRVSHPAIDEPIKRALPGITEDTLNYIGRVWDEKCMAYELKLVIALKNGEIAPALDYPSLFRTFALPDHQRQCINPLLKCMETLPVPPGSGKYMVY